MTTTPHEPLEDPEITPSGDPAPSPEPEAPIMDPETQPHADPPVES